MQRCNDGRGSIVRKAPRYSLSSEQRRSATLPDQMAILASPRSEPERRSLPPYSGGLSMPLLGVRSQTIAG